MTEQGPASTNRSDDDGGCAEQVAGIDGATAQEFTLGAATRERRELESDLIESLCLAEHIQLAMLPSLGRQQMLAESTGIHIASHFRPSALLGGDIWGLCELGSEGTGVFMVDFCGHGIAAALNTVRIHTLLQGMQEYYREPDQLLHHLNLRLLNLLPVGDFATMWYGILDVTRDSLRYAAAGSPPALILRHDKPDLVELDGAGVPLGVSPEALYELRTAPITRASSLLLYSDALYDTAKVQQRSVADVASSLRATSDPQALIRGLCADILGDPPEACSDDLTVVCLTR